MNIRSRSWGRGIIGLALAALCLGVSACTFELDKPLISTADAAYPLPLTANVHIYQQDEDDPQKWELSGLSVYLKPDEMTKLGDKYEGNSELDSIGSVEGFRYKYPDIYAALTDVSVSSAKPGYWIGESWVMFSRLEPSSNEYLIQLRQKFENDEGVEETSYLFGLGKKVGHDRLFFYFPAPSDMPEWKKEKYNCTSEGFSLTCPDIDTTAEMKDALSSTPRDYKSYLQIQSRYQ